VSWQATLLAEHDNVAVALRPIAAGEVVLVRTPLGSREVVAVEPIPLCHKIAVADLAAGEAVVKYGWCIGEARSAIPRGAWVHVHNLASRRARPRIDGPSA
jgi:altronate dehydratase